MTRNCGTNDVLRWSAFGPGSVVIACAAVAMVTACTRAEDKPLPADPKARSEFVEAQSAKLTEDNRRRLDRFLARVRAQEAAGGPTPKVSIAKAVELQRVYDSDVAQAQSRYLERIAAAKADVRIDVREQSIVKEDPTKSPSGKALRYVVDVTNIGKRVIERIVLRIDFRDESGKYMASVPGLELKGPLQPSEAGRTIQMLALNPKYHAALIEGRPAQITPNPAQIVYAAGETLDAEVELKKLQTLARTKIE